MTWRARRIGVSRLRNDTRAVTVVEFAIVAPVMCLLLVGALDMAHTLFTQATLQGAIQKAARDNALETGTATAVTTAIDNQVKAQMLNLTHEATFDISRRYYRSFSKAAAAAGETYTDTNGNGKCDAGEPYQDDNNNSQYDKDGSATGQGGAKDRAIYTVKMKYPRLLPMASMIGFSNDVELEASTILQNQPYSDQGGSVVRNCTP